MARPEDALQAGLLSPGHAVQCPVAIHEIIDGRVQDVGYSTDRFNFGDLALAKDSTRTWAMRASAWSIRSTAMTRKMKS
jgi:glucan biosynthesis protein